MPEGLSPQEIEWYEIKKAVRFLGIQASDFKQEIIDSWEREYDTELDATNFHIFIYDRFSDPIKYLHSIKNICIKSLHTQEVKPENTD